MSRVVDMSCDLDHVLRVKLQSVQIGQISDFVPMESLLSTYARTLEVQGCVIACFGVTPLWDGVVEAWALLSDEVLKDYPITLSKSVLKWLDYIEKREGIRRIQSSIAEEHVEAIRWIRWLGFKRCEGLMKNYGIGGVGNFYRFARIN